MKTEKKEKFTHDRTLRELFQDVPTTLIKLLIEKKTRGDKDAICDRVRE